MRSSASRTWRALASTRRVLRPTACPAKVVHDLPGLNIFRLGLARGRLAGGLTVVRAPWKSKYVESIERMAASHAVSPLARRLNESDVGAEKGDEDARESDCVAGEECFHVGFSVRAPWRLPMLKNLFKLMTRCGRVEITVP